MERGRVVVVIVVIVVDYAEGAVLFEDRGMYDGAWGEERPELIVGDGFAFAREAALLRGDFELKVGVNPLTAGVSFSTGYSGVERLSLTSSRSCSCSVECASSFSLKRARPTSANCFR